MQTSIHREASGRDCCQSASWQVQQPKAKIEKKDSQSNKDKKEKCPNCPPHYRPHAKQKCPAQGKASTACKKKNHFARSKACKSTGGVRSVEEVDTYQYDYSSNEQIKRIETICHNQQVPIENVC